MQKQVFQDPKAILQIAIEELDVFTKLEASRLEVGENGRLVAAQESRLERVVGLARCYIAPFFSDQIKAQQEKRLVEIKKAILRARDIVKSHSPLIEKFKEGDEIQRKLAESALSAIQRYNAIVAQDSTGLSKSDVYNYERQRLLSDEEIKGQQIELPHTISIKYDSHPDGHPAHQMLKELRELSQSSRRKIGQKSPSSVPTHKKSIQFMIDTFQMKAIRMIEMHLKKPVAEIVPLVKRAQPEIEEENSANLIHMQQLIEVDAGSVILVTGCFKCNAAHLMAMPILDSFRLSFQATHSGFPYAFQHTGWVLGDKWVEAFPLRVDQTPHFHRVNQRRKSLAHRLLFDQDFKQKVHRYFQMKGKIFDLNRDIFLPLHHQLYQALQSHAAFQGSPSLVEAFYQKASCAPSSFDILVQAQQQAVDLFIQQPIKALEEEWLEEASTPLRMGAPQEKYQAARLKLEEHRHLMQKQFDSPHCYDAYVMQQGLFLGQAFQSIALQYQSEKMGFSPPLLNEFERKLQICAFQQLLGFLNECENCLDNLEPAQIKGNLLMALSKDLQLIETSDEDERALPVVIVNELETYFQGRFKGDGL